MSADVLFWQVRGVLISELARRRRVVTHTELADLVGRLCDREPETIPDLLHECLAEIAMYEGRHERPMLTATVVGADLREPTGGFFECAEALGHAVGHEREAQLRFWEQQRDAAASHWTAVARDGGA